MKNLVIFILLCILMSLRCSKESEYTTPKPVPTQAGHKQGYRKTGKLCPISVYRTLINKQKETSMQNQMQQNFHIYDWAGNLCFLESFQTFDDAEEFLSIYLNDNELDYDETRGEYQILERNN